jgi:hypothetical protein
VRKDQSYLASRGLEDLECKPSTTCSRAASSTSTCPFAGP